MQTLRSSLLYSWNKITSKIKASAFEKGDFTGLNVIQPTSETEDKTEEKKMNYITQNITDYGGGGKDNEKPEI